MQAAGSLGLGGRRPEIDWVKGFAILCVLLIHAKPLEGFAIQTKLFDRAVPIFVVIFGLTSERWWQARSAMPLPRRVKDWYASRLRRLMIPVWATLIGWWIIELSFTRLNPTPALYAPLTVLGYWPWVGTGWFVTLILLLVAAYPFLHFLLQRLGDAPTLVIAAVILWISYHNMFTVIEWQRWLLFDTAPSQNPFFYFWIFAPAWFYAVTAGAIITRRRVAAPFWLAAICFAASYVALKIVAWVGVDLRTIRATSALVDPLLATGLLGALPLIAWWRPGARLLAWCGVWSWGIYLGQLLVHNAFHALGMNVFTLQPGARWAYFGSLLIGAIGLAVAGQAAREVPLREWLPQWPSRTE